MDRNDLKKMIALAAIAAANCDGFTVDAKTLQPITKGFAVSVADTQNSFGFAGMAKVYEFVKLNPQINAFGGWFNSGNGRFYFDATLVVDSLEAAKALGRLHKQLAVFDLENCKEIRL